MKKWIWFLLCGFIIFQLSCSKSTQTLRQNTSKEMDEGRYSSGLGMVAEEASKPTGTPSPVIQEANVRKIIQNGSVDMEVEDPEKTSSSIEQYIVSKKGYIANARKEDVQDVVTVYLQIKIPVQEWSGFMAFLKQQGKIKKESVFTNEITKEYYDTAARLKNKQDQLVQYKLLLGKAMKIEDILAVQQQIDNVQEMIEVYKGQLNLWDQQVALSTIDINIRQYPATQVTSKNPSWDFLTGSELWKLLKNNIIVVFSGIIRFIQYFLVILIVYVLPIGLLIWFFYWLVQKIIQAWKKQQQKKK
jgi:hypothetical protein